jgi:16S rRNA A1518/A1519 N6-dimethyltransferase RsmA/KsgA/DIM1 with predicted DNA glycosylase/AP lyase activity
MPDLYERARPSYPSNVFDGLCRARSASNRGVTSRIGWGTGQATVPLAQYGYAITCVEIGEHLCTNAPDVAAGRMDGARDRRRACQAL